MSETEYDGEDYDDEDWQDGLACCACGSNWFVFVTASGDPARFLILPDGDTVDTTGHPRCGKCGLDYPLVWEDEDGEPNICLSTDLDLESERLMLEDGW